MRLYWVLFSIEDLRLVVETAKRILRKGKIDRQLAGQSSSIPFMNMRDGYNSKKVVTFDTQDRLDDKLHMLTSMMSKLAAQGNNQNKQFKPNIYQGKIRVIIRISIGQIVEIGEHHLEVEVSMDRIIEECHNMLILIEMTLGEQILEECKIKEVKLLEVDMG